MTLIVVIQTPSSARGITAASTPQLFLPRPPPQEVARKVGIFTVTRY